jgi:hypothetical protein
MKKIMTFAILVAASVTLNAASYQWSSTGSVYTPGTQTAMAHIDAYLFDVDTVSQATLLAGLREGKSITSYSALSTYSGDQAKIATTKFDVSLDPGANLNAYFAIVTTVGDTDYVYISNQKTGAAQATLTTSLSFASQSTNSGKVNGLSDAFSNPGWYTTAAVPEPTSGLLMLVGLAGLALRRRRA